jgi:ketosteroid isomerase-like protein
MVDDASAPVSTPNKSSLKGAPVASSSEIAWSYFSLLNDGRFEEALELLDDNGTQWGLLKKEDVPLSQLKVGLRNLWEKVPMRFTRHSALDIGEHAVLELESNATRPDGKSYNNRYCFVISIANSKIVRMHEYGDTLLGREMLDAVGMLDPAGHWSLRSP